MSRMAATWKRVSALEEALEATSGGFRLATTSDRRRDRDVLEKRRDAQDRLTPHVILVSGERNVGWIVARSVAGPG